MRTTPEELVKRYEAAGWWKPETLGDLLAAGLAAAPRRRVRPRAESGSRSARCRVGGFWRPTRRCG